MVKEDAKLLFEEKLCGDEGVSESWEVFDNIINKIYDDFDYTKYESYNNGYKRGELNAKADILQRVCENCKFYVKTTQKNHICNLNHDIWHLDRGCEQWEQK